MKVFSQTIVDIHDDGFSKPEEVNLECMVQVNDAESRCAVFRKPGKLP